MNDLDQLPLLTFDDVDVGQDLGTLSYAMTEEKLRHFRSATGDPGALYPTIATKDFYYLLHNRFRVGLMLHAKHDSSYVRPPAPGIQVRVRGRIADKYVRRGRPLIVVESISEDDAGQLLVRSRTTFLPLGEGEGGGRSDHGGPGAERPDPEPAGAGALKPGVVLGPLTRHLTTELMEEFERCSELIVERPRRESIHVNPDLARQAGQPAPVASGMHSVAHLGHLLRDALGDAWSNGGHLVVNHVRPLYAGDELTAHAVVTGVVEGSTGRRLLLDVWCQNAGGYKTTVGSADVALADLPA